MTRITRLFEPQPLVLGETIALGQAASHHLSNVLRLMPGAVVYVFNGQGGEYRAELTRVGKRQVDVYLHEYIDVDRESTLRVHLAQGLPRADRMDWLLQKTTECGVHSIAPLMTEYTQTKLPPERREKKLAHWEQVTISACEQSGRTHIPTVHLPQTFDSWCEQCQTDTKLLLMPEAKQTLAAIQAEPSDVTILIGPEGGLSQRECERAIKLGFQPVRMGPRILRAETAAIAAVSALQLRWGDLQ